MRAATETEVTADGHTVLSVAYYSETGATVALYACGMGATCPVGGDHLPSEAYGWWSNAKREQYHRPEASEKRVYRPDYGKPTHHRAFHRAVITATDGRTLLCKPCAERGEWVEMAVIV